jgi:hypothetical protein
VHWPAPPGPSLPKVSTRSGGSFGPIKARRPRLCAIPLPGWARLVDGRLKRLASPVRVRRPGFCLGREPGGRDVTGRVGQLERHPDAMLKAAGRIGSGRQAGGAGLRLRHTYAAAAFLSPELRRYACRSYHAAGTKRGRTLCAKS